MIVGLVAALAVVVAFLANSALTTLGSGGVAFVVAAAQGGLPEWLAALGVVAHTLILLVFALGALWPAVAHLLKSISAAQAPTIPD